MSGLDEIGAALNNEEFFLEYLPTMSRRTIAVLAQRHSVGGAATN